MCLAVPGKIVAIDESDLFRMAVVDFLGVRRKVCIDTVDASVGDYVVAHAGIAISVMDTEMALATIADLEQMTELRERIHNGDGNSESM
ncbi:MAG: HypC/HybG/HupF family hydrogenase formation chaperone [Bacteroidales bacterium]|nr:HypC/HybG/HupF family hydrogenase formation chaperone [Bacteroidales bacterium]MBD5378110.1 HypC/HybG/HupF family hydrogenase formation chaperone [Bacteroides sp.]